jgi:hypothetical protein
LTLNTFEGFTTATASIALLKDEGNWDCIEYTGTTAAPGCQGQFYYEDDFLYLATLDDTWIRWRLCCEPCEPEEKQFINVFDFSSGSTTVIATASTYEILQMTGTTGYSRGTDLIYTNPAEIAWGGTLSVIKFEIVSTLNANPNNELAMAVFFNNAVWPCSEQSGVAGVGGNLNLVTQCLVEMQAGDTIDIRVKNVSSTQNIDLVNVNIIITEM